MTDEAGTIRGLDPALEEVLARALGGSGRVVIVGSGDRASGLASRRPDRFVSADALSPAPDEISAVLVLDAGQEFLAGGAQAARNLGTPHVFVLVERDAAENERSLSPFSGDLRERLRAAGLAVAGTERLLFDRPAHDSIAAARRSERLDAETRALLLRCVRADDPGATRELEEAIAGLERRLDLLSQLAVDHARTRDVERERAERLARLEHVLADEARPLAEELERLRSEVEGVQSTRLWRVGQRWWRLRARMRRAR